MCNRVDLHNQVATNFPSMRPHWYQLSTPPLGRFEKTVTQTIFCVLRRNLGEVPSSVLSTGDPWVGTYGRFGPMEVAAFLWKAGSQASTNRGVVGFTMGTGHGSTQDRMWSILSNTSLICSGGHGFFQILFRGIPLREAQTP